MESNFRLVILYQERSIDLRGKHLESLSSTRMDIRCNSPGTIFFVIELLAVILFYSLLPMHFGASGPLPGSGKLQHRYWSIHSCALFTSCRLGWRSTSKVIQMSRPMQGVEPAIPRHQDDLWHENALSIVDLRKWGKPLQ